MNLDVRLFLSKHDCDQVQRAGLVCAGRGSEGARARVARPCLRGLRLLLDTCRCVDCARAMTAAAAGRLCR